jgi:hypothetical protein
VRFDFAFDQALPLIGALKRDSAIFGIKRRPLPAHRCHRSMASHVLHSGLQ